MSSRWAVSSESRAIAAADGRKSTAAENRRREGYLTLGCVRSEVLASPSRTAGPGQHRGGTYPPSYLPPGEVTLARETRRPRSGRALSRHLLHRYERGLSVVQPESCEVDDNQHLIAVRRLLLAPDGPGVAALAIGGSALPIIEQEAAPRPQTTPPAPQTSHDLDAPAAARRDRSRTTRVTRPRCRGVAAPSPKQPPSGNPRAGGSDRSSDAVGASMQPRRLLVVESRLTGSCWLAGRCGRQPEASDVGTGAQSPKTPGSGRSSTHPDADANPTGS